MKTDIPIKDLGYTAIVAPILPLVPDRLQKSGVLIIYKTYLAYYPELFSTVILQEFFSY